MYLNEYMHIKQLCMLHDTVQRCEKTVESHCAIEIRFIRLLLLIIILLINNNIIIIIIIIIYLYE